MTEIRYLQKGEIVRISVNGHAMFNPGNDIVCAGVSAITYQMLACVSKLDADGLVYDATADIHDGSVIVQFDLAPETFETWNTMWSVIRTGYENIAERYPDNVALV